MGGLLLYTKPKKKKKLVTLHGDGVERVKPRCTPPKGKAVAIDGDLGMCSLLKTNLVIGRRFWFEKVLDLLFECVTHNLILIFIFLSETFFVFLVCIWITYLYSISVEMNKIFF